MCRCMIVSKPISTGENLILIDNFQNAIINFKSTKVFNK